MRDAQVGWPRIAKNGLVRKLATLGYACFIGVDDDREGGREGGEGPAIHRLVSQRPSRFWCSVGSAISTFAEKSFGVWRSLEVTRKKCV